MAQAAVQQRATRWWTAGSAMTGVGVVEVKAAKQQQQQQQHGCVV